MSKISLKIVSKLEKGRWETLVNSDFFSVQENLNYRPSKNEDQTLFRIISKSFPQYRVIQSDDYDYVLCFYKFLHEELEIPPSLGKVNIKKILKILKTTVIPDYLDQERNKSQNGEELEDTSEESSASFDELEEGLGISNILPVDMAPLSNESNSNLFQDDMISSEMPVHEHNNSILLDKEGLESDEELETGSPTVSEATQYWYFIKNSLQDMFLERTGTTLDIGNLIKSYYESLAGPSMNSGKHETLQSIRDRHMSRQRRFVLASFTIFALLMRFCSFDLFLILLIISNFVVLYILRNAKRINMQLAKKSVKNRVGWAKQYLGGLIGKKSGQNETNLNSAKKTAETLRMSGGYAETSKEPEEPKSKTKSISFKNRANRSAAAQNSGQTRSKTSLHSSRYENDASPKESIYSVSSKADILSLLSDITSNTSLMDPFDSSPKPFHDDLVRNPSPGIVKKGFFRKKIQPS